MSSPETPPSERVVEQRARNRIIEALEILSDGRAGMAIVGVVNYFELFFDSVDDRWPGWRELSTLTPSEVDGLHLVHDLLLEAVDATARWPDEQFVRSIWPDLIRAQATSVYDAMRSRGRFDEEVEEAEPGTVGTE